MSFTFFYDNQPAKFLERLDKHIATRIKEKIESSLIENPVPQNATTITGEQGVFRIRIGDFRALYRINYKDKKVIIVKIDKRSRVYK